MTRLLGPSGRTIVLLVHSYCPSDVRVWRYVMGLRRTAWDVEVHCLRNEGQPARETIEGVRVVRTAIRHRRGSLARYVLEYGAFSMAACWRLMMRRRRPDVVHVHTPPDFLVFAALPARLRGAHVLLDLHEIMPEFFQQKYGVSSRHVAVRAIRAVERASIRFADRAVTVSDPLRERFIERGANGSHLTVVMNAPDRETFPYASSAYLTGKAPVDRHRLVYNGTLTSLYGVDLTIRAIAATRERWPYHLDLYGDGEQLPALKALVAELGLEDRVAFHGRVSHAEMPRILRTAGAGVLATRPGPMLDLSLSNKLLEMLWVGLPVIAADLPAYRRYVGPDAALYFRPGDMDSLAQSLARLAALSDADRAVLGQRGATVASRWQWEDQLKHYLGLLADLCGDDSVPPQ